MVSFNLPEALVISSDKRHPSEMSNHVNIVDEIRQLSIDRFDAALVSEFIATFQRLTANLPIIDYLLQM